MSYKTGEEILAYCGQCKMDLMANIVAMKGETVIRVHCRTCKGERKYKPPKGVKEPGAQSTGEAVIRKKRSSAASTPKEEAVPVGIEWEKQMSANTAAPRVSYSTSMELKTGQVVQHPSFGDGLVTKIIFPNKAEILFQDDVRLLLHSRK